jgi:hypothetical protein
MTQMLKKAFDQASLLPDAVQNTIAALVLAEAGSQRAQSDPFLAAHLNAPLDDESVTDEDLVALREGLEDLANGRTLSQEEVRQRFAGEL